jgi:hypothetical protein
MKSSLFRTDELGEVAEMQVHLLETARLRGTGTSTSDVVLG